MESSDIFKSLNILLSTEKHGDKTTQDNSSVLSHIDNNIKRCMDFVNTKQALKKLFIDIESSYKEETSLPWKFVMVNLHHLQAISGCVKEKLESPQYGPLKPTDPPPLPPDALSISHEKLVQTSLDISVAFGLSPNLMTGVGIHVEKRSNFADVITSEKSPEMINENEKDRRLMYIATQWLQFMTIPSLCDIILSRHLGDILSGLLQIVYGPKLKISESTKPDVEPVKPLSITDSDRAKCFEQLQNITRKVFQPYLVKELLLLQGPPKTIKDRPRSPVWLRKCCGKMLTDILLKDKGVQNVLRGMVDPEPGKITSVTWQKCEAVAAIIAHCPRDITSIEQYYSNISSQILELLHLEDQGLVKQYLKVAVSTITKIFSKSRPLSEKYIFNPLFEPLLNCLEGGNAANVSEECVDRVIFDIHKVFVAGREPNSPLITMICPIVNVLFNCYLYIKGGVSHLKKPMLEILNIYLKHERGEYVLAHLQLIVFGSVLIQSHGKEFLGKVMCSDILPVIGANGGLSLKQKHKTLDASDLLSEGVEEKSQCIVEVLKTTNRENITSQVFLLLLDELTSFISVELADAEKPAASPSRGTFLEAQWSEEDHVSKIQRNLTVLSLLGCMCDQLGDTCFKETSKIIDFVEKTLQRGITVLTNTDDNELSVFESDTIAMAMGLLTAVMSGAADVTSADREKSKSLMPLLQSIADNHNDKDIKEMANDLRIAIATHGMVLSELVESKGREHKIKPTKQSTANVEKKNSKTVETVKTESKKQPMIQVLSSTENLLHENSTELYNKYSNIDKSLLDENVESVCDNVVSGVQGSQLLDDTEKNQDNVIDSDDDSDVDDELKIDQTQRLLETKRRERESCVDSAFTSSLKEAFEELLDPLIPVRGHALISLRQLIEKNDKNALDKQDTILNIFKENIEHDDTYIYLSAIEGLAALATKQPTSVVPVIAHEYANFLQRKSRGNSSEVRMKIGEVLVKATRALGDLAPSYRDLLLPCMLCGAKDTDPMVRASCLINLGELCKLLRFSLGSVSREVFECVGALLKSDPDIEVRKASALYTTLLLEGVGPDLLKQLSAVIRDFYRLLKHVYVVEKDEVVLLHVGMALERLDTIMKQFLFPKQSLAKRIHVLDAPGNL